VSRRGWAVTIALLWLVALGWLAKREFFRTTSERLAEAALAVAPGTAFYRITLGSQQVGFTSMTVDTQGTTLAVTDFLVLEIPTAGGMRRTRARSVATVNRALRTERLDARAEGPDAAFAAHGIVTGDTVLSLVVLSAGGADSQGMRLRLDRPLLLPSLVPLRLALGGAGALKPGRNLELQVFDPLELMQHDVTIAVGPESTFAVPDSAIFDSTTFTWTAAHLDTVRAFRIDERRQGLLTREWVDAEGRLVRAAAASGLTLERTAYEIAYQNFRHRDTVRLIAAEAHHPATRGGGIPEVAEDPRHAAPTARRTLRARISGISPAAVPIENTRQRLSGDTLVVTQDPDSLLVSRYALPARDPALGPWLAPAPLLPCDAPSVHALALAILGSERDPRLAAARLAAWVRENIHPGPPTGAPNALSVLRHRSGGSNERAVTFVSLARAAGLPARTVGGLLEQDGAWVPYAWAEVYLGGWVAVDPGLEQLPADARHVRLVVDGLAREVELLRFLGRMNIEVL